MENTFAGVHGKLGFGCMRLPGENDIIDNDSFCTMIDSFIAAGFNYFDTAHGYHGGRSETALAECLTSRYPRESYILADKLSCNFFEREEDIIPLFESQLAACGVDYFDYYLMHAQNSAYYRKYKECRAYETVAGLKAQGRVRHMGISFHDKADVLDMILSEQPEIEFVQIQFNYVDYEDPGVQARLCLETCRRYGKPVIVMEPVRGGSLANLPSAARLLMQEKGGGSPASYAIRYAAGFDGVVLVLSGMSNMAQINENIAFMRDFTPLNENEHAMLDRVKELLSVQDAIPCTACRYCIDGCPKHISIPDLFACLNSKKQFSNWNSDWYYMVHTQDAGRAADCIGCGKCESVCPQHLEIRRFLAEVSAEFDHLDIKDE